MAKSTLEAILEMAQDDNKGLMMTTTTLDGGTINGVSHVKFQVTPDVTKSANIQAIGGKGDYMCVAFFIDRNELKKYK